MQGKLGEESIGFAIDAAHLQVVANAQRRLEQPMHEQLRERIGHAHGEPQAAAGGAALHGLAEFATERKDFVSVAVDHPAGLGEHDRPTGAIEELGFERFLQGLDLPAHGGLGEMEKPAGLRDAPLAGRDPEIEEVVVVEPVHGGPPASSATHRYFR